MVSYYATMTIYNAYDAPQNPQLMHMSVRLTLPLGANSQIPATIFQLRLTSADTATASAKHPHCP
jgi:hypothetical protein